MSYDPKCNSKVVRRPRTRSRWERWHKEITHKRPCQCRICDWRGWMALELIETEDTGSHRRSMVPDLPNLAGTLLARADPQMQLNLKELDRFGSRPETNDS